MTSLSQVKDTVICKGLNQVNILTTLSNYEFSSKLLNASKESIVNGFEITLSDNTYKILGFRAYYLGDDCDIYYKDILGKIVTKNNFPILNRVKDGLIEIECVTISKGKELYLAKPLRLLFK